MKKVISLVAGGLVGLALLASCATGGSASTSTAATPAPAAAATEQPAAAPASDAAAPAGDVSIDTAGNSFAATIGAVTVVVDKDTTLTPAKNKDGASVTVVDFEGKKAIKVTRNSSGEVRIAFVLNQPAKLTDYKTLEFSIAGFNGYEGHYNCGLFYTENKPGSNEKMASFYLSNCLKDKWTTVSFDLKANEQWAKNFSQDKEMYGLQFWSDKARTLYISDLALKK